MDQNNLKMTGVTFVIEPIEGRSAIQKNFVTLPERAPNYSNRRVTLNERFSIIERGYYLKPVNLPQKSQKRQIRIVCMDNISPEERIASCIAKMKKKQMQSQNMKSKSQEAPPYISSSDSVASTQRAPSSGSSSDSIATIQESSPCMSSSDSIASIEESSPYVNSSNSSLSE